MNSVAGALPVRSIGCIVALEEFRMSSRNGHARLSLTRRLIIAAMAMLLIGGGGAQAAVPASSAQRTFASPEEAVQALVAAVKAGESTMRPITPTTKAASGTPS